MGKQHLRQTALIVLFSLAMFGTRAAERYRMGQKIAPNWGAVPRNLDGWIGVDGTFDSAYGWDPADTSLLRVYARPGAPPVITYVGFYSNLSTYMEFHTPEVCYPAQGWTVLSSGRSARIINTRGQFRPERAIVDRNGQRRLVIWWYYAGSHAFENRIRYASSVLILSSLGGRRDGSMVRLETPIEGGDEERADKRVEEFENSFLASLGQALPR
jgi:EpsI family protein